MQETVSRSVREARDFLAERLREIKQRHLSGAPGGEVVAAMTGLIDTVVCRHAAQRLQERGTGREPLPSGMALVALGGYGRGDLAPHSDVDLMFLYHCRVRPQAEAVVKELVRDLWDVRLKLGSSMRTVADCVELAQEEPTVHTALLEARLLYGDEELFRELQQALAPLRRGRRGREFLHSALQARLAEQAKYGSTVQLLEPDVKCSKGGLRDLHLIRWVARCVHGSAEWVELARDGLLNSDEVEWLQAAREFLLRVRNDLHFHAGRARDTLAFEDQVRAARFFQFQNRPGMLAVEQFMQQYYRHTGAIDDICERFVNRSLKEPFWRRFRRALFAHRLEGKYRVYADQVGISGRAEEQVLTDPESILRLFEVAHRGGADVADELREKIRLAVSSMSCEDFAPARPVFLRLLGCPGNLGRTLRRLHSLGILERLIPEFSHARGLIQFNECHKYTVDEHSLLCVAQAEGFQKDPGSLGRAYRQIRHKEVLHLALLLHDLGKGFDQDHCELGREIALRNARRFSLEPLQRDLLVFLVHQHLLMSRLAFRRDTTDEQLLTRFARQVGTPEVLRMLYVMTACDVGSVGPGTWTRWKEDLLAGLYQRTWEKLSADSVLSDPEETARQVQGEVLKQVETRLSRKACEERLQAMPLRYLLSTPTQQIVEDLLSLHELPAAEVKTSGCYHPEPGTTEYTIYTSEEVARGLFSKIAGVLAAKGLQILGAQIWTHGDGRVVDRFQVIDYDFPQGPNPDRIREIGEAIRDVLLGRRQVEDLFGAPRLLDPRYRQISPALWEPPQVRVDNDSSQRFTILEVFAMDCQGLLYVIARTLFELGLSVSLAKITTSLDQVLDVFYVTDVAGSKVTDPMRLQAIREQLTTAIREFEREKGQGPRSGGKASS